MACSIIRLQDGMFYPNSLNLSLLSVTLASELPQSLKMYKSPRYLIFQELIFLHATYCSVVLLYIWLSCGLIPIRCDINCHDCVWICCALLMFLVIVKVNTEIWTLWPMDLLTSEIFWNVMRTLSSDLLILSEVFLVCLLRLFELKL